MKREMEQRGVAMTKTKREQEDYDRRHAAIS
jgi:hypothetical protein